MYERWFLSGRRARSGEVRRDREAGMKPVEVTTRVNAPRDKVFAVFTDFPSAPDRVEEVLSVEMLSSGPVGVGTRFRETRMQSGGGQTLAFELTEFEAPSRYVIQTYAAATLWRTEYTFDALGAETRVSLVMSAIPQTLLARLMGVLLGLMARGRMLTSMQGYVTAIGRSCEVEPESS